MLKSKSRNNYLTLFLSCCLIVGVIIANGVIANVL